MTDFSSETIEKLAELSAVKAAELVLSRVGSGPDNPVSEKCARVLEDLEAGKVHCWDFRQTRRAAACSAWQIMETEHLAWADAIKRGWSKVREKCSWGEGGK